MTVSAVEFFKQREIRELKHATFLGHGRQPEGEHFSGQDLGFSQIFKLIVSASAKRLKLKFKCGSVKT